MTFLGNSNMLEAVIKLNLAMSMLNPLETGHREYNKVNTANGYDSTCTKTY